MTSNKIREDTTNKLANMCLYCCCTVSDLILYIIAVFIPPLAVLFRSGLCSSDLLLNVLLTMLGVLPGMIHAFYYINMTSPLRRNAEYAYFYQQGWADSERQAGSSAGSPCNHRSPSPRNVNYGSIEGPSIQSQIQSQPQKNENSGTGPIKSVKLEPVNAPPPYSELP